MNDPEENSERNTVVEPIFEIVFTTVDFLCDNRVTSAKLICNISVSINNQINILNLSRKKVPLIKYVKVRLLFLIFLENFLDFFMVKMAKAGSF